MKLLLLFLSAIAMAVAYVNLEDWHPPDNGDARSPCPALNSLANHYVLPHDGRNITLPILVKALGEGLNLSTDLATTLSMVGIALSPNPANGQFDLSDLMKHNAVEHDGSLSRKDYDLGGESQAFCSLVFQETLSYYKGAKDVGFAEVAAARWGRQQSSKANNAKYVYGPPQVFNSYSESAVYLQLLKDPRTQKASVEWIKIFFSQERLPYKEGWRPINRIDGLSLSQNMLQIALHTPEKAPGVSF